VASLKSELGSMEADVAGLTQEMEVSIARSQTLIDDMQLVSG